MMTDININSPKYNITDVFGEVLSSHTQFNLELWNVFTEAYPIWLSTASEYNKSWKNLSELDKVLRTKFRKTLD